MDVAVKRFAIKRGRVAHGLALSYEYLGVVHYISWCGVKTAHTLIKSHKGMSECKSCEKAYESWQKRVANEMR